LGYPGNKNEKGRLENIYSTIYVISKSFISRCIAKSN